MFGGTFDPLHAGHLMVAQDIHEDLGLDRTLFVPAHRPPHRPEGVVLDAERRARLVAAGIQGDDRFALWDGELRRKGTSYTVDSLEALEKEYPGAVLFLLLGSDQFATFDRWNRPERIAELATLVVAERGGGEARAPGVYANHPVRTRVVDVSATEIRDRIRRGRSVRYLVPESVRRIIEEEGWYKTG